MAGIAIASLDCGEGIAHDQIKDWVASWGGANEKPAPEVMNPIWSPEAIVDLAALRVYIAQDDPAGELQLNARQQPSVGVSALSQ